GAIESQRHTATRAERDRPKIRRAEGRRGLEGVRAGSWSVRLNCNRVAAIRALAEHEERRLRAGNPAVFQNVPIATRDDPEVRVWVIDRAVLPECVRGSGSR